MITHIQSRNEDIKKISFLASSISPELLSTFQSDTTSKLFSFSDDGQVIEFAFKRTDDKFAFIPLEPSDRSFLSDDVAAALKDMKQELHKEIAVAYSNSNLDFMHRVGEFNDIEEAKAVEIEVSTHSTTSDKYENPIFDIDLKAENIQASYNPASNSFDIKISGDYGSLREDDRQALTDANILQNDGDKEAIVLPATIALYTNDILFHNVDDTSIKTDDAQSFVNKCANYCNEYVDLRNKILDSAELELHQQFTELPEAKFVEADNTKSTDEILKNITVATSDDAYADIKINNIQHLIADEPLIVLDELHDTGH